MNFPLHRLARLGLLAVALACLSPGAIGVDALTPDGGRYSGPLVNGLRHGQGVVEWDNGARYEGGFINGLYSGHGKLRLPSGQFYEGEFRNGLTEGQGRMTLLSEGVYTGAFHLGTFWGKGELVYPEGRKYRGDFVRNQFHGKGRFETPEGEIFEGDFANDQFAGQGRYTAPDGGRFEGEFKNWRLDGHGKYTTPDGTVYEGEFKDNGMTEGTRIGADGSRYEGGFSGYEPHGHGTLTLANGDRYVGSFEYGSYHGAGTLTFAKPAPDGPKELRGTWSYGQLPDSERERRTGANIETALYTQRSTLDKTLAALKPREAGRINLYLLTVAGDGRQEVFRREADFVRTQFDRDFGTAGRSLGLTNSRNTVATTPLATLTSLRESLQRLATLMDKDNDILFVYLTSHGSHDHEFSLAMEAMDFADIKAAELARLLKESGIRHKVVVISACYAGGFIPLLKDERTLIITAAREDRTSFGCSDENDFTYFGRAYFKEALPQSSSFPDAFRRAEKLIGEWENRDAKAAATAAKPDTKDAAKPEKDDSYRSFPQIASAPAIERQLDAWWKQRRAPAAPR